MADVEAPVSETTAAGTGPSTEADVSAETSAKLLRQLEYYFCDVAFPFDEFLQSQADENGSVPVATLAGSPRVVSLLPAMTEAQRVAAIGAAIADSDSVKRVGEDRLARIHPLPKDDPAQDRSCYIAGLSKAADEAQLKALMARANGSEGFLPIVKLRRLRNLQTDRSYNGQVFVELEDEAKAAAFVKVANKGGIPCNKCKLLRDFYESQEKSVVEQREKRAAKMAAGGAGSAGEGAKRAREPAAAPERPTPEPGLVLRFDGVGGEADREAVAAVCAPHGDVGFVSFSRGETSGSVRFKTLAHAQAALAALSGAAVEVGGAAPTWRTLTAEEETHYYEEYNARVQQKKRQRGGGGGYRGGRGRGRSGR